MEGLSTIHEMTFATTIITEIGLRVWLVYIAMFNISLHSGRTRTLRPCSVKTTFFGLCCVPIDRPNCVWPSSVKLDLQQRRLAMRCDADEGMPKECTGGRHIQYRTTATDNTTTRSQHLQ